MKIGVMFGNPETTSGGRALKFYASVRLEIRKLQSLKSGNEFNGIKVRVKVVKNKVAPPFRVAEFDIMFNEGISKEGGLIDVGTTFGVLKRSGSWYEYEGEKLGQGREAAKDFLRQNPKIYADIDKKVRLASKDPHEVLLQVGGDDEGESEETDENTLEE